MEGGSRDSVWDIWDIVEPLESNEDTTWPLRHLTTLLQQATMETCSAGQWTMAGWIPIQIGKILVLVGLALVVIGLLVMGASKLSFFGLGRLPGDIAYKGKNFIFYFPIVSSVVLSIVLTLILWLISSLGKK